MTQSNACSRSATALLARAARRLPVARPAPNTLYVRISGARATPGSQLARLMAWRNPAVECSASPSTPNVCTRTLLEVKVARRWPATAYVNTCTSCPASASTSTAPTRLGTVSTLARGYTMPTFIRCCSHTIVPMVRRGPVGLALALVAIAVVLTWAELAIEALTVCLNETPDLASGLRAQFPASDATARWLLAFLTPLGVSAGPTPVCDVAAPARAMAVAGLAYVAGICILDLGNVPRLLSWPVVIGVAIVARVALLFVPGLLSSDIIDYATHGRVASLHAANPYVLTPSQFPSDPFANLGAWPTTVTVYGPLWTRVDTVLT